LILKIFNDDVSALALRGRTIKFANSSR